VLVVDSHVHYWAPETPERPWDRTRQVLGEQFLVEELLAEADAAGVDRVVQVTPGLMGHDNRYALEAAAAQERVAGVFGRLDPSVERYEERLRKLAAQPKFTGLRFTMFGATEQGWIDDGSFDRLLEAMEALGLAAAIFFPKPRALAALAERHPGLTVLADHLATDHRNVHRDPSSDTFAAWSDVLALARLPNVWLKVSNVAELSRRPFPFDDIAPRVRDVYETFGPERLIWGTNYPPSKERATYAESVRFFRELSFIPVEDKAKIMGANLLAVTARARTGAPGPTKATPG